jgi:transcriptional regulator with XRE-family HTH domain
MNHRAPRTTVSTFLKSARLRLYRTTREFWETHEDRLGVSYPHYSAVESGSKFPDIKLAINAGELLKVDLKLLCNIWARDQMPDARTKGFFEPGSEVAEVSHVGKMNATLDDFYVFNDAQQPFLMKNEFVWDVSCLINSYSGFLDPTKEEIAEKLELTPAQVDIALDWLLEQKVVFKVKNAYKAARRFFHIPNSEAYKTFRDRNFFRFSKEIIPKMTQEQFTEKTAFRGSALRRMTPAQASLVVEQINNLLGMFSNFEDHGDELYVMTLALGPRLKLRRATTKETKK